MQKVSSVTYTEDGDEAIDGRNLKTCNTCKVPRSKKCNIEQYHLWKIEMSLSTVPKGRTNETQFTSSLAFQNSRFAQNGSKIA